MLVDPHRSNQLAEALAKVLTSPDVQASLRARGLARAKEFQWDRTAKQTVAIYERTVGC